MRTLYFCLDVHTMRDIIVCMKTRIDIRIDAELKGFLQHYAGANHTTITQILTQYIVGLKKRHGNDLSVSNLSDKRTNKDA